MTKPHLDVPSYVQLIARKFEAEGDPVRAEGQMRYMRDRFPYHGLKAPEWTAILRELFNEHGKYNGEELYDFVRQCFDCEYREMHYAGLQMLEKQVRKLPMEGIDCLEEFALTKSWWDSVDWINKLVGIHFRRFPQLQRPTARKWIDNDNIWLQRLAIIHQLTYKEDTDWELMKEMILRRAGTKEFFVQKGAGWALRSYSRMDPEGVVDFVEKNEGLAPLTKRESLKWLKSTGQL